MTEFYKQAYERIIILIVLSVQTSHVAPEKKKNLLDNFSYTFLVNVNCTIVALTTNFIQPLSSFTLSLSCVSRSKFCNATLTEKPHGDEPVKCVYM